MQLLEICQRSNELKSQLIHAARTNELERLIDYSFEKIQSLFELSYINFKSPQELSKQELRKLEKNNYLVKKTETLFTVQNGTLFLVVQILRSEKLEQLELVSLVDLFQTLAWILENQQIISDLTINNERLLQKDRDKNQIISTISHELKTPLANIMGFAELMEKRKLKQKEQQTYSLEILKSAKRLSNLVQNFLDLSKIENTGKLVLNSMEEFEIDFIVEEAWQHVNHLGKNHEITWKIQEDLPNFKGDVDALTRVFINLFFNAIKYSPKKDEPLLDKKQGAKQSIVCEINSNSNSEIIIKITDQGIGIAASDKNKIFRRFGRLTNAIERNINGTGLSLWICKQIINLHNGKIWFESELDEGSSFYVALPVEQHNDRKILLF